MMGATMNDITGQLAALRDLGALPADTDLDAVIHDLGLDQPPVDPTTLTADELVHEIQRTVKALLGYGARMPKELMLFVKNMVFLDGAIATPRPRPRPVRRDHGHLAVLRRRATASASPPTSASTRWTCQLDLDGVKARFGVDASTESLTYRELQRRRELIGKRLRNRSSE